MGQANGHSGLLPESHLKTLGKNAIAKYVKRKTFIIFLKISAMARLGTSG